MTSAEIINWLMPAIGFLLVYVLNGVKSEVKEIKTSMQSLEKDLRDKLSSMDSRLIRLEVTCRHEHGEE